MASVDALLEPRPLSDHPVDVGLRTEAIIAGALVRLGHQVLLPFGTNQRYDMVVELDGRFLRCQCKTGRLRDGAITFSAQSVRSNRRKEVWRDYAGQIDLFLVYCRETDGVYAVPIEEGFRRAGSLRVTPPSNGQRRRIRWAADYALSAAPAAVAASIDSVAPPE